MATDTKDQQSNVAETKVAAPAAAAGAATADVTTVKTDVVENTTAAAVAQAPAAMFAKPEVADADTNPTRVKMITAAIAAYSTDCGRAQANAAKRKTAALDLMRGIRLMASLSFGDYGKVAEFLVKTIQENTNEAFHPRYIFMFADEMTGRDKDRFMLPMTAYLQFARLKNKATVRQRVDVSAIVALMETAGAKKAVDAFFPS